MNLLRHSTSQVIQLGPFLDSTDFVTAETALTITQADMQLSKNGGVFAQKNTTGDAVHDLDGWYSTTLDTTDTDTVGNLILKVNVAGTLPVYYEYCVLPTATYDALTSDGLYNFDPSTDTVLADMVSISGDSLAADNLEAMYDGTGYVNANGPATASALATVDSNVDSILVDTGTTLPSQIASLNDISVSDILTTSMAESYSADGSAPSLAQSLYLIQQMLGDFSISGTTLTVKKLDGSTTAATFTLNDATSPTLITRTT